MVASRDVLWPGEGELDESSMAVAVWDVPARHASTIVAFHTLRPFAVAGVGESEFDPFMDQRLKGLLKPTLDP